MPKVSLRIGQAEVYVPLQQLEEATRQLLAGQNLTPQPNPGKHGTLASLAGDMLNLVELKLGSNFAGLGSAMIVGRKHFNPQDRWAANALRGLHEALAFTRHFTDLGEQAWRTKVAEAIARMESDAYEEFKEENLQELSRKECKAQSRTSLQKAPNTSAQAEGKGCQEQKNANVEARPKQSENQ